MGGILQNQSYIANEIASFGFNIFPPEELEDVQKVGIEDLRFCKLIEWMCNEISVLYGLDETVHAPTGTDNMEFFLLELSSMLSELECPVDALTHGPIEERFRSTENQTKLLNFLIGHMKCARLTALNRLHEETFKYTNDEVLHLENAFAAVGMNQLPADITVEKVFSTLKNLAEKQMDKCKEKPHPLLTASLSDTQWEKIAAINEKLIQEYRTRILLLLKRLDVTIQSFTWSDRIKKMQDKLHEVYRPRRERIMVTSNVNMDDLLAATSSLLIVDKIMNEKERKRTASQLNKVLMTDRPGDRGGRPSELRAPPPEMPAWIKDRVSDQGRQRGDYRGGGGGGYRGGGGRYQGGGISQDVYGGRGYQSGGGSYQSGGGSYQSGGGYYQNNGGYQGRGGYYESYGGRGFANAGRNGGFENQVMREYEGYHNQGHDGRRGSGRRGRGGYGGQRGYR